MATNSKLFSLRLNAFLLKPGVSNFEAYLSDLGAGVKKYSLDGSLKMDGIIFVKESAMRRPTWAAQLDKLHGQSILELKAASASAVLFIQEGKRTVAFTFGYGRYLLDDTQIVPDFGIKTALNTLTNTTLRSVDLYSLEQEPMQKRTQAVRNSNVGSFGIDVSRDVLKAVTGEARSGIAWVSIHGAGPQYSFTAKLKSFTELKKIAVELGVNYDLLTYQKDFGWVDNIQLVRNESLRTMLDKILESELQNGIVKNCQLTMPDIVEWDKIAGFSFTNSKKKISPMLSADEYFSVNAASTHTVEKLKSNKVFCFDVHDNEISYPVYGCLYYHCQHQGKTYILFSNSWFSIDQEFLERIDAALVNIPISTLPFPKVRTYTSAPPIGKSASKVTPIVTVESEGDYNVRASTLLGFYLLDKKLVKPRMGASSVELCDILSKTQQFIHAKHRKGGSAGISHLFAQGRVSAELMLSDQAFREDAQTKLPTVAKKHINFKKFNPSEAAVIFLVLGVSSADVMKDMPFFSKVNLWATYQGLVQRNFKVFVAGAELDTVTIVMPSPAKTIATTTAKALKAKK